MAQINKPSDYFNTKLYTGNATVRSITGVGFQPDWTWIKRRSGADNHYLFDAVRGTLKFLQSNGTDAEVTRASSLTSFDSDGFSLGTHGDVNSSGQTFASWSWLASNTTASNTDGSITSTVSANTTSGFSIVSYTGDGNTDATVGHGLGVAPKMIITKNRSNATATNWTVYHASLSANNALTLNQDGGAYLPSPLMVTTVGASTFTLGSSRREINQSSDTYICYCFADVKGFSKFGSYTGNGSADGTFVYTGFKPAFIIAKRSDGANNWIMHDNKRPEYNPTNILFPNLSNAELSSNNQFDILSNGFKCRASTSDSNTSGGSYIYMCFAESPLVGTNNIPAVAR